jgi:superfamily I DNA/RNA helicase
MFNKNTKDEFERDMNEKLQRSLETVEVKTLNGFGHDLLLSSGKKFFLPRKGESSIVLELAKVLAEDGEKTMVDARALAHFIELIQNKLVPYDDVNAVKKLASDFDVDVSAWVQESVAELFRRKLASISNFRKIDHSDQIWLPVERKLTCPDQYDWVFVDECQDLCSAQVALLKKVGIWILVF